MRNYRNKIRIVAGILFITLLVSAVYANNTDNITNANNTDNITVVNNTKIVPSKGISRAPEEVKIEYLDKLPTVNATELNRRQDILNKTNIKTETKINKSAIIVGPKNGTETKISRGKPLQNETQNPLQNPLQVFANIPLGGAGTPKSVIHEPSEAMSNDYQNIFWTANWYAARSINEGVTFSYIDPYADFPSFCCDQDVIYDPINKMFIWYRLGTPDANNVNYFRLGVSNDNGNTWFFYNFFPTDTDPTWTNQWWDYPNLALSGSNLYLSSNMFSGTGVNSQFQRSIVFQIPLAQLHQQTTVNYFYFWSSQVSTFTFAQEPSGTATNEMFFASNGFSTNTMDIYTWNEPTGQISFNRRLIDAWTVGTLHQCPGPDGTDSCQRSDNKITGGWHMGGKVGFFWNVAQGNGFNYPYIDAAQFDDATLTYGCGGNCPARPYIWNPAEAIQYGFAAPDAFGNLGIDFFIAGGGTNPLYSVGIWDAFSSTPPPWTALDVNIGTNGPAINAWGDYIRVRAVAGSQETWSGSGYTLQGGQTGGFVDPRLVFFGRNPPPPPPQILKTIAVTPSNVVLNSSQNQIFTATALDTNNNPMPNVNIFWQLSDETLGVINPLTGNTDFNGNTSTTFVPRTFGGSILSAINFQTSISGFAQIIVLNSTVKQMALVRGSDNALWYRLNNGISWGNWLSLGGVLSSDPDAVSPSIGHVAVVARGSDNALWFRTWNGTTWSNWVSLGGVLSSGPGIASPSTNNLDVFVRGTDNALWYKTFNGNSWGNWSSLGGILSSDPEASNLLDIFVRGMDNALWTRPYNTTTNKWDNWQSLGGTLVGGPSATSFGATEFVFARGTDNSLWYRFNIGGGGWGGWASLGGILVSDPGSTSVPNPLHLSVFVRGSDNGLWYRDFNGSVWSNWNSLGGILSSGPAAASWT